MKTYKEKSGRVVELVHVLWFVIYHMGCCICYLIKAPFQAIQCTIGYWKSAFYKITGMPKENFCNGSAWKIGNDQRYLLCNAIEKMNLPLEAVAAMQPNVQEEALLYYYIYKGTVIITHGFYRAMLEDDYHIARDHSIDLYEYDKAYSVSQFCEMNWAKYIRPEHKHLPIKVLHSNPKYRFQGVCTDAFDSHEYGIFYRRTKDLKKIFDRRKL